MDKNEIISKIIGNLLNIQQDGEYITVAELSTIEKNGITETVDFNTAIIPEALVGKIKSSHVNPFVERSAENYDKNYIYIPSFWIYLSKASGLKKAEPLVVSWSSGNHTTYNIDQGFLSTFQLSPRILNEEVLWDDLKRPIYAVVKNKPLSEYKFPIHSKAYVKIKKDYLGDYLYLRKKIAVQIFTIKKNIPITEEIDFLLRKKDYFIEERPQFEIRVRRYDHKKGEANLEINGYKVLFPGNGNSDKLQDTEPIGHIWKGIEGQVTYWRARHEMPSEYVYVSDEVLAKYQTDEDYDVHPLSGSVSYRNQWSVSYCERVGLNAIKIEIKKLYEGNNDEIIDYWNRFSIHPSEILDGENIASKAEQLTKNFFLFGRLFAKLVNHFFNSEYTALDIISLDEKQIEYTGWSNFSVYKPITHYVDLKSFSKEQFISRCKKLYILLGENLVEKSLRKIVDSLHFSTSETQKLRSLKLLELIFKYFHISSTTGLDPHNQSEAIIERIGELKEFNDLSSLFALTSIRHLDAHKTGDSKSKFEKALKDLGIEPNSIANNYSTACFRVYDNLIAMFNKLNTVLLDCEVRIN